MPIKLFTAVRRARDFLTASTALRPSFFGRRGRCTTLPLIHQHFCLPTTVLLINCNSNTIFEKWKVPVSINNIIFIKFVDNKRVLNNCLVEIVGSQLSDSLTANYFPHRLTLNVPNTSTVLFILLFIFIKVQNVIIEFKIE